MKKIKTKILLNAFLGVLFAAGIVGILASYMNFNSTLKTLQQSLESSAKLAAQAVTNTLDGYIMLADELSQHNVLLGNGNLEDKRAELAALQVSSRYLAVEFLDENGIAVSNGMDYSEQDTFLAARDRGESFITDPVVQGDMTSIYLSYPIKRDNEFCGAVVLTLDGQLLSHLVSEIKIGDGGSAYIIAKNGNTIASPFYDSVLKQQNTQQDAQTNPAVKSLAPIEAAMCRGETGFGSYQYDGVQKIAAYCPIPGTTWSIDVAATRSDFMEATNRSLFVTLMMIIIMGVFSYLMAHYTARTIATPIVESSQRLQLLADGDFHTPVTRFETKDEAGSLAESTAILVNDLQNVVFDISNALGEMAEGNFAIDFNHEYKGDLKPIQDAMIKILRSLSETLYQIDITASQVSEGSDQVSGGAQVLSEGATQQASAVEELSASVQTIAGEVQNNAENARQANEKAGSVGCLLSESKTRMDELTTAMDEIRSTAGQIGKIIQTIEDIAFQTNIVALNAAVEAARAGATGKGFAVVADEVRNLAAKSATASKGIAALIESSLLAVGRGAELTSTTADSLTQVVEGAQEIITTVERISTASSQQAHSIAEVSIGVEQISMVVQNNSATAEESAAASEQLLTQAIALKEMVDQFRLQAYVYKTM